MPGAAIRMRLTRRTFRNVVGNALHACCALPPPLQMLFFAKVLRTATEEDVRNLFSKYGGVEDINLFRAFKGAPTNKVCRCT